MITGTANIKLPRRTTHRTKIGMYVYNNSTTPTTAATTAAAAAAAAAAASNNKLIFPANAVHV